MFVIVCEEGGRGGGGGGDNFRLKTIDSTNAEEQGSNLLHATQ